jgi:predicted NUDIX family NTP pyrophosphohydrolase
VISTSTISTENRPLSVAVGDFNNDNHTDLVVVNWRSSGTVSVLLGHGDGSFGIPKEFSSGRLTLSIAIGDFNGDNHIDLAAANKGIAAETVSILLGDGTGNFEPQQMFLSRDSSYSIVVGDFNGDNRMDLAIANNKNNTISIFLNSY